MDFLAFVEKPLVVECSPEVNAKIKKSLFEIILKTTMSAIYEALEPFVLLENSPVHLYGDMNLILQV